ncbi:MAG: SRPBCC family protein, partial [Aeromicrobium sp.]
MPRTTKHQIRVATDIAAPVDVVWVRISDHVGTPTWVHQVECVTLAKDGIPHNGLGAVRVVEFKPRLWSTIHEEITRFEPPHSFEYVLF